MQARPAISIQLLRLFEVMKDTNFKLLKDYLHGFVGDLPTQNEMEAVKLRRFIIYLKPSIIDRYVSSTLSV